MKIANFDATYQDLLTGVVGMVATTAATAASTVKPVVRVATTAAGTLATSFADGQTVDGITLATGDRILVKDQASGAENGVYVVESGGPPTRAPDSDASTEIVGAIIAVLEGTSNGGTIWHNTNTGTITVDTTALTYASISTSIPAGTYVLTIEGGQETIKAHGSMGATETFDPTDGNIHTGTLDADCTFTISAPSGSGLASLELWITQDGTGGRTITWPGSVTADGTITPDTTAGVTVRYVLETIDGGTNWILDLIGGTASPLTTKGDLYGFGTANARIPVGTSGQVLTADPAQTLGVKWAASAGSHAHVAGETHLSDGSTTTYTLDNYYEPGSVIAWNTTTIARLVVTEVLPDRATVSAAGTSGDKIVFDYAASL